MRMTHNYFRIGGIAAYLPNGWTEWTATVATTVDQPITPLSVNQSCSRRLFHTAASVNSTPKEKQGKQEREEDPDEPKRNEKRQKSGNSVFLAPLPLSGALVKFLGTGENALPQCDVVKRIWDYIKQNNLLFMLERGVDQWVELCNNFNSNKFRASSANIENQSKKKYNHRTSRPLSYIVEEMTVTPSRRSTRSMGASPGGENKLESNASDRRRTAFSIPTEDAKTKEITKMKACKTDSTKKSKKNHKRKSYIPQNGVLRFRLIKQFVKKDAIIFDSVCWHRQFEDDARLWGLEWFLKEAATKDIYDGLLRALPRTETSEEKIGDTWKIVPFPLVYNTEKIYPSGS
ncbi:Uncharacterized protein Fot_35125, partial [Forsythia ovata]